MVCGRHLIKCVAKKKHALSLSAECALFWRRGVWRERLACVLMAAHSVGTAHTMLTNKLFRDEHTKASCDSLHKTSGYHW